MAVKCNTSTKAIRELTIKAAEILNEELSKGLAYLGEACVKRIRDDKSNWTDWSGNLRSSIGYAVCNYGRTLIKSKFESVTGTTGDGTAGSQAGKDYIEQLASQYTDVYVLVVVAGMDYAEYLELVHGRDVLQGTEVWAKTEVDKVLKVFQGRAERRINKLIREL